jgi:acetyl esterase/lipase
MNQLRNPQSAPQDFAFRRSVQGEDIAVRVFGARSTATVVPLVLYFHGGLFNCGTVQDAEPLAHALSESAVIACVDYPLAPAVRFPDTVEITFEALQWASAHAAELGADAKRVFVAGDEAGGNLAAAATLIARDRNARADAPRPLAGQILLSPLLDPSQASASMRMAADCPCREAWGEYLPFVSDAMHPYAAPIHSRRLGGLPPALIITAEKCPLRDEAEEYAAKLIAAGVPVRVRRMNKTEGGLSDPAHPHFGEVVDAVAQFIRETR